MSTSFVKIKNMMEKHEAPFGFKWTDVGLIPEEWDVSTVGVEFIIQLGKMLDSAKNTGVLKPYLGNRAVQWNSIKTDAVLFMRMTNSELQRFRLISQDLLVCEGGEVGRAAMWEDQLPECYYQKALHRLRPKHGFNVRLMMSFLQLWAAEGRFANYVTQTSIAHLPKEKFEQMPLPVPSPDEQEAIASVLSDVDTLIGTIDKLLAKKRAIRLGSIQELLTGSVRLGSFAGATTMFVNTEVGRIPQDWGVRALGDEIVGLEAGVSVNSEDDEVDINSGDLAILKTSAVADGIFIPTECKKIARRDISRARVSPRAGSILISRMNTPDLVGECGYVEKDYRNLRLPDRLWMTKFSSQTSVSSKWLTYILSSDKYKNRLKEIATGTSGSMKNIAKTALLSLVIPWPEPEEQRAIASVISDMDTEIAALEQRREKTKAVKWGIMQLLLRGRTRLA